MSKHFNYTVALYPLNESFPSETKFDVQRAGVFFISELLISQTMKTNSNHYCVQQKNSTNPNLCWLSCVFHGEINRSFLVISVMEDKMAHVN